MRAFETERPRSPRLTAVSTTSRTRSTRRLEVNSGLTAEIVEQISKEKHDPDWMREFRLKALDIYNKASIPNWGPSLEGLDSAQYRHIRAPQHRDARQVERSADRHQEHV